MNEDKIHIEQFQKGNLQSFSALVEKYQRIVFTLAFRTVNNTNEAEEIAQDCFLKVYQKLSDFRGDSLFSSWLYRIVYNTSISYIRKKKLKNISIDDEKFNFGDNEPLDYNADYYEEVYSQRSEILHKAIGNLMPDESFILTLFHLKDVPIKEISEITELSESNVKVKLFRARKKLEQLLRNEFEKNGLIQI